MLSLLHIDYFIFVLATKFNINVKEIISNAFRDWNALFSIKLTEVILFYLYLPSISILDSKTKLLTHLPLV